MRCRSSSDREDGLTQSARHDGLREVGAARSIWRFLITIYDEWVRHDVGYLRQTFEVTPQPAAWGLGMCLQQTGTGLVSAQAILFVDHFVEPNIAGQYSKRAYDELVPHQRS
jgi:hypothetical protein